MWSDMNVVDAGTKVPQNVGILPHHYMVSEPRISQLEFTFPFL